MSALKSLCGLVVVASLAGVGFTFANSQPSAPTKLPGNCCDHHDHCCSSEAPCCSSNAACCAAAGCETEGCTAECCSAECCANGCTGPAAAACCHAGVSSVLTAGGKSKACVSGAACCDGEEGCGTAECAGDKCPASEGK